MVGDEAKTTLTVNYSQMFTVAIGAIQELKAQHDQQLGTLRSETGDLKTRLERIEKALESLADGK